MMASESDTFLEPPVTLMQDNLLLDLDNVTVTYGVGQNAVVALSKVDLKIRSGEFVAVVGPSGCGKSTLMHAIAGFIQPTSGTIKLNGHPVSKPSSDRAVVLQQATLFPWLDVFGNVELGPRSRGVGKQARHQLVERYLNLVGLADVRHRKTYELSGGMQQRVALARALANEAEILLVDEPFGALDALTRDRMQREIVRIWHETKKTIIFITHDVEEATFCSTSVVAMDPNPGRIVERIEVPFSRRYATHAQTSREIRSSPAFIETREAVLREVLKDEMLES